MSAKKKQKKRRRWPAVLAAGLLCAAGVGLWMQGRMPGGAQTVMQPVTPLPEHAYDWSLLTTDELGRRHYIGADGTAAKVGIDVSKHQGSIDWQAVAADGIEFAFVRAGSRGYESGEIYPDDTLIPNLEGASDAGLSVGVYFYSQAVDEAEAVQEAEYVLSMIKDRPMDLPIVMDYEEVLSETSRTGALTPTARTDNAVAFCERIRQAGYRVMVYSTRSMLLNGFDLARLEAYDLWVADFNETLGFPYRFTAWQYTERGRVAGIGPDVDLNLMFS